jgi:pyrimidine operon attenuation protein/uracil phosphoribosyltransferase
VPDVVLFGDLKKLTTMPGKPLPDAEQLLQALIEKMRPDVGPETGLVGIHTGGVWLAERLHDALGVQTPLGSLDVSFYRDDYEKIGLHRDVKRSDVPFEVEGRPLVIVDDVLFTGRTIRAAMNELFDYGRPSSIRLAALIDRGGRELPIAAQWVGANMDLSPTEAIELKRDVQNRLSLAWYERSDADVA